jgi:hypothetical protein
VLVWHIHRSHIYATVLHALFLVILIIGGCQIEGEDDSWDFGTGAGFYVDATEDKWKKNYRMYSYITKEVLCFDLI